MNGPHLQTVLVLCRQYDAGALGAQPLVVATLVARDANGDIVCCRHAWRDGGVALLAELNRDELDTVPRVSAVLH